MKSKIDFDIRLYKRLLAYVKPYWGLIAISLVFALLVSASDGILPWLVKPIMDDIFVNKNLELLRLIPPTLLLLYFVKGCSRFGQSYLMRAVGQRVIIPNGRRDLVIPAPALDPNYPLAWPIVGVVTQGYSPEHLAVDIGSAYGANVYAAEAGTVVHAQWARTGYGFTVIIDHGNNRQTLYSHLKGALVQPGQAVSRGEIIGAVGSTGNSTGPHVHFEVRQDGERVNPFDYLRPM